MREKPRGGGASEKRRREHGSNIVIAQKKLLTFADGSVSIRRKLADRLYAYCIMHTGRKLEIACFKQSRVIGVIGERHLKLNCML